MIVSTSLLFWGFVFNVRARSVVQVVFFDEPSGYRSGYDAASLREAIVALKKIEALSPQILGDLYQREQGLGTTCLKNTQGIPEPEFYHYNQSKNGLPIQQLLQIYG